jgi:Peptidase propeptide and YPEB domain
MHADNRRRGPRATNQEEGTMRASLVLIGLACAGCSQLHAPQATSAGIADADRPDAAVAADEDDDDGDEQEIDVDQVPAAARDAALAALPGFVIEEAEREVEDGVTLYSLEGTVGGDEYEVEVTAGGKVREIEPADDEDDDGED